MSKVKKVAAVVVTYNRLDMLKENLEGLCKQKYKDLDIILIDNASTDGTGEYIKKLNFSNLIYINTGKNLGGAGGFYHGVKEASIRGYKYAWIMDDDTIPYEDSLDQLMISAKKLNNDFSFLCSYVEWIDHNPCYMNEPRIFSSKWFKFSNLLCDSLLAVRSCTFVSVLINLEVASKAGLPLKELFIYGDDHEYTERLSKFANGYLSFNSKVLHKMKENTGFDIVNVSSDRISRYYYDSRNRVYRAKKIGILEFIYTIIWYIIVKFRILFNSNDKKIKRIYVIVKGFYAGLFFNPKVEYVNKISKEK